MLTMTIKDTEAYQKKREAARIRIAITRKKGEKKGKGGNNLIRLIRSTLLSLNDQIR